MRMAIGATTVGPITPENRDRLKRYRDEEGHSDYNSALSALLDEAAEETSSPGAMEHE